MRKYAHTCRHTAKFPAAGGSGSAAEQVGNGLPDRSAVAYPLRRCVLGQAQPVSSLEREAAINPAVQHVSPALRWQARGRGWLALGFQHAPGMRASFAPGSPDLPAVVHAIERISRITLPLVAQDWRESRYDRHAIGTAGLFAGGTLLHGDINPDNLLVGPGGDVAIVDWSWPTHGAAFIDPACLVVQLVAADHTPAQAEDWAARCTAWREADPAAVDAFAAATVRMYQRFEQLDPEPWRKAMTAAASWAERRGQRAAGPGALPAPIEKLKGSDRPGSCGGRCPGADRGDRRAGQERERASAAGLGRGVLCCVHQGIVRLGGAGCRDAQGFDQRGEPGLDGLCVGVVGGHALGFDEAADSFQLIDAH
jgi:hypothetical protein